MNVSRAFFAALILGSCGAPAWAQPAPGSHFGRTSSGMDAGMEAAAAPRMRRTAASVATRPAADPLAPYTSRPRGASSGTPIAMAEEQPPRPPVIRNYFPAARSGQVRHHCTPSRASSLGARR